jgi:transcription antitermination factor NusG
MRNSQKVGARSLLGGTMDSKPWYVLQVLTNQEKKVAQHLTVRELEHYLPLYRERSQWSDRVVNLERPLFAGYVFVRFEPRARLAAVSTPGVLRLLGDDELHTVPAPEIERIRVGLTRGDLLRPHPWVAVGFRVRVCRGSFDGAEGVITDLRKPCKVVLALAATQQCFSLEVDLGDIELLDRDTGVESAGKNRHLKLDPVSADDGHRKIQAEAPATRLG